MSALVPLLRRAGDHIDRHSDQPLDLERRAAVAGVSQYHFARRFTATFGTTPIRYLTRRRIERAQDLLRHADLTVTEVCTVVGFASLGSFSSRVTALTGETPTAYRARWAERGGPHVPGCFLFMRGVLDPTGTAQPGRASGTSEPPRFTHDHQRLARHRLLPRPGRHPRLLRRRPRLHPQERFRWLTVGHPNQPELDVTLMLPGPPLDDEAASFVRGQLERGQMGGIGLHVDDCRATFEELSAKGVTFVQEPADRPDGVEAVIRDNTGNWLALVEPKEFSAADVA